MADEEPQEDCAQVGNEILQAALARTIATSVIEAQAYRVSGSGLSSVKTQGKEQSSKISYTAGAASNIAIRFWKQK